MNTQQSEIDVLKVQIKTLKRMCYGFGCLVVAGIALAATSMQGVPDVIEAKAFYVVNDEGKCVISLDQSEGGELSIRDKDGKPVARLNSYYYGARLDIYNNEGKEVAIFGANPDGGTLAIGNKDGKSAAQLNATEDGGELKIKNGDGPALAALGASPLGGGLIIANKDERAVVGLAVTPEDGGALVLMNKDGKAVFAAPEDFAATVKEAAGN